MSCTCPNCGTVFEPVTKRAAKRQPKVSRAPSKPNDRSKMWHAMHVLRCVFSAQEVAAAAKCEVASTRVYINALIQGGYLTVEKATRFEVGDYTIYRLINRTGPHAPRLRADGKSIFDPNSHAEVPRVRA